MADQLISDALLYFLDEKNVCLDVEFPDNGIDHAYSMKAEEWNMLLKIWDKLTEEWRHAIIFFAAYSYIEDSGPLITKALYDENEEIIEQALFSLAESALAELDEENHRRSLDSMELTNQLRYHFSKEDQTKIISELDRRKSEFKEHPELAELKKIILEQA